MTAKEKKLRTLITNITPHPFFLPSLPHHPQQIQQLKIHRFPRGRRKPREGGRRRDTSCSHCTIHPNKTTRNNYSLTIFTFHMERESSIPCTLTPKTRDDGGSRQRKTAPTQERHGTTHPKRKLPVVALWLFSPCSTITPPSSKENLSSGRERNTVPDGSESYKCRIAQSSRMREKKVRCRK